MHVIVKHKTEIIESKKQYIDNTFVDKLNLCLNCED
jgi:hypothetical protein